MTGSSYHAPPITEEEIKGIVEQGLADKALEKDETELVHGALRIDDTTVRTIMTPRTKMFSLPAKMLLFEALPQINKNGRSRVPLYDGSHDRITGFIYARDILKELERDNKMITLSRIARKPIFVSQEKMVSSLLKEMQGRKIHMAIVVDEHGGVEGLVTMEDLLEEIVGEIEDEAEVSKPQTHQRIDRDTITASGEMEIAAINKMFNAGIPEGDDYGTLSGFLHEQLRDIPMEGDKVEIENLRIVVEKSQNNIPVKVRIERIRS